MYSVLSDFDMQVIISNAGKPEVNFGEELIVAFIGEHRSPRDETLAAITAGTIEKIGLSPTGELTQKLSEIIKIAYPFSTRLTFYRVIFLHFAFEVEEPKTKVASAESPTYPLIIGTNWCSVMFKIRNFNNRYEVNINPTHCITLLCEVTINSICKCFVFFLLAFAYRI